LLREGNSVEADWEVEIGPGAPIIDAQWPGFVDLRASNLREVEQAREVVSQLPEVSQLPGLAEALVRMNGDGSPIWTSKCDVWPLTDLSEIDPDEMQATAETAAYAWGCYVDLLPRSGDHRSVPEWVVPTMAVSWCKSMCGRLHSVPLRQCRVDLLVRRAVLAKEGEDVGITAYLTACGTSPQEAQEVLGKALDCFVDAFCVASTIE
jgi:hypothetical protein